MSAAPQRAQSSLSGARRRKVQRQIFQPYGLFPPPPSPLPQSHGRCCQDAREIPCEADARVPQVPPQSIRRLECGRSTRRSPSWPTPCGSLISTIFHRQAPLPAAASASRQWCAARLTCRHRLRQAYSQAVRRKATGMRQPPQHLFSCPQHIRQTRF